MKPSHALIVVAIFVVTVIFLLHISDKYVETNSNTMIHDLLDHHHEYNDDSDHALGQAPSPNYVAAAPIGRPMLRGSYHV